jgi:hypothetical protein
MMLLNRKSDSVLFFYFDQSSGTCITAFVTRLLSLQWNAHL